MTEFVYEYFFINSFDEAVFNNGPVSDVNFLNLVKETADMITTVLECNQGIPNLSSLVTYDVTGDQYKVTVKKQR